jgi:hypothetical protein
MYLFVNERAHNVILCNFNHTHAGLPFSMQRIFLIEGLVLFIPKMATGAIRKEGMGQ